MADGSVVWTSFRALEPNPHPYSPMTQSILKRGLETSALITAIQQDAPIATFHRGYLYFNVEEFRRLMAYFFDVPQTVLVQYLRDDVDVELDEISVRPSLKGLKHLARLSKESASTILHGLRIKQRLPDQPPISELSSTQIQSLIESHLTFLTRAVTAHALFSVLAEAYAVSIERYVPRSPSRQGVQNIISHRTNSKTFEMARWAARLEDDEELESFLNTFGHRCPREMEIAVPRWRDDPRMLSKTASQKQSRSTEGETSGGIPMKVARLALLPGSLLESLRENPKNEWLKSYAYLRDALIEVGNRATQTGYFTAPEDVFYVSQRTARTLLNDPPSRRYIRTNVARAKNEHELNQTYTPPLFTDDRFRPVKRQSSMDNDGPIQGLGVSEGTVSGRVIYALSPEEVDIPTGSKPHILVTEFTDAGWTPLFFQIDGLVMERGSLLSHGSIVAREAGIPAVANAANVLNQFQTGDPIEVNGNDGTVKMPKG